MFLNHKNIFGYIKRKTFNLVTKRTKAVSNMIFFKISFINRDGFYTKSKFKFEKILICISKTVLILFYLQKNYLFYTLKGWNAKTITTNIMITIFSSQVRRIMLFEFLAMKLAVFKHAHVITSDPSCR